VRTLALKARPALSSQGGLSVRSLPVDPSLSPLGSTGDELEESPNRPALTCFLSFSLRLCARPQDDKEKEKKRTIPRR